MFFEVKGKVDTKKYVLTSKNEYTRTDRLFGYSKPQKRKWTLTKKHGEFDTREEVEEWLKKPRHMDYRQISQYFNLYENVDGKLKSVPLHVEYEVIGNIHKENEESVEK